MINCMKSSAGFAVDYHLQPTRFQEILDLPERATTPSGIKAFDTAVVDTIIGGIGGGGIV